MQLRKRRKLMHLKRKLVPFAIIAAFLINAGCAGTTKTASQGGAEDQRLREAQEEKSIEELKYEMTVAYNLGDDRYRQEDYINALPFYWKTNEIDRQINGNNLRYPGIFQKIGRSYAELGHLDSTFYSYVEGLKYSPRNLTYFQWIQWYHLSEGRIDEYIATTEEILTIENDLSEQQPHIVRVKDIYKSRQEYEKAKEKIELLLTFDPDNKELILEHTGMIRNIGGDAALQEEYEKQHLQNPTDTDVIWNLLSNYADQGLHEKVIEFVDKYLALKPGDIDARSKKIEALRATNRFDEAIAGLREISVIRRTDPQYLWEIADIFHVDKKDLPKAMDWAYKARQKNRGFGKASYKIATVIVDHVENVMKKYGRSTPTVDDKLIYEIAVFYFKEAAKDPNTRAQAEKYAQYYGEVFIRTTEDKFMHRGYDTPKTREYAWVWKYKK